VREADQLEKRASTTNSWEFDLDLFLPIGRHRASSPEIGLDPHERQRMHGDL